MRCESLEQWLAWLETGSNARIELGLERVAEVLGRLGHSRSPWTVVTVAGTNGKGSCVALLDSILQHGGYRVGAYTSPHLLSYNERVRIAGAPVEDADLCAAFERVESVRGDVPLTYFEFGTLAAIDLFARTPLDVVILEVGLGGRLDACNVIDSDVALISSIGIDHASWLGKDREQIGSEKAGILRSGRPAVCADPDPPASLLAAAQRLGTRLYCVGRDFRCAGAPPGWRWWCDTRRREALPLPVLPGLHQVRNAASVLMVAELLSGRLPVGQGAVRAGLTQLRLPGRFQVIPGAVETILDVAHNPDAAGALAASLMSRPCAGRTLAVLGMLSDKDTGGIAQALADVVDAWFVGGLDVERGLSGQALARRLGECGITAERVCASIGEAWQAARAAARDKDRIVVFGSFLTVAHVLRQTL